MSAHPSFGHQHAPVWCNYGCWKFSIHWCWYCRWSYWTEVGCRYCGIYGADLQPAFLQTLTQAKGTRVNIEGSSYCLFDIRRRWDDWQLTIVQWQPLHCAELPCLER